MNKRLLKTFITALSCALLIGMAPAGWAEALSQETGEAILQELKQIRTLLERIERSGGLAARPSRKAPARVKVALSDRPIRGDKDAPLTLVEFTDYQCPYCQRFFRDTYPQLKAKYIDTGKLRLVVKDFPLSFHKNARKAAQAAHCAGDQERFWEMHDLLFDNANRLQAKLLPGYAEALSMDVAEFDECLASNRHLTAIDGDSRDARTAGITGTPSFVLGKTDGDTLVGARITGAKPLQIFERQIEALLAQLKSQ